MGTEIENINYYRIYMTIEKIPTSSFCLLYFSQNPEVLQSFLFKAFHEVFTLETSTSGSLSQSPVKVI